MLILGLLNLYNPHSTLGSLGCHGNIDVWSNSPWFQGPLGLIYIELTVELHSSWLEWRQLTIISTQGPLIGYIEMFHYWQYQIKIHGTFSSTYTTATKYTAWLHKSSVVDRAKVLNERGEEYLLISGSYVYSAKIVNCNCEELKIFILWNKQTAARHTSYSFKRSGSPAQHTLSS